MKDEKLEAIAAQHGLSVDAVRTLQQALQRGGGKMAQFNHPELGGSGQWMPGMIMVGDMFNNALKAKVQGVCEALLQSTPMSTTFPSMGTMRMDAWWGDDLGEPTTAGGQNDMRYAYFSEKNRLAVERSGKVYVYDTNGHKITGAMQQQANTAQTLAFNTERGSMTEAEFKLLETRPTQA